MDQPTATPSSPPAAKHQPTWSDSFSQLDVYADQLRVKLPLAPPGLLDGYMRFAPWIAIIFGVLGVLLMFVALGLATFLTPFLVVFGGASGLGYGGGLFLAVIVGLVSAALEVVGGYLMLQRRATGWWILAAGLLVNLLSNLLRGSILVLIIVALIAYIHLEVKPNYR
jgi:hypothetical protein